MKTYLSLNEILKVAFVRKLLNISLKKEISFVVLRKPFIFFKPIIIIYKF